LLKLTITPLAKRDLIEIGDYIALDNPARATSFISEIETVITGLAAQPLLHPARDDLAPGLRAARHGRYLIFFLPQETELLVVRVLHGAHDLTKLLSEL